LAVFAPVAQKLGFKPLPDGEFKIAGSSYTSALLDFGSSSVDGWLAELGSTELGIEEKILDPEAHELIIDGERIKLTKLEFEVFQYLYQRKGNTVTRASLIEGSVGLEAHRQQCG
jgi:hypothetical protein